MLQVKLVLKNYDINRLFKQYRKRTYLKVGVDYNMYTNWGGLENMVYFGFRFGLLISIKP